MRTQPVDVQVSWCPATAANKDGFQKYAVDKNVVMVSATVVALCHRVVRLSRSGRGRITQWIATEKDAKELLQIFPTRIPSILLTDNRCCSSPSMQSKHASRWD
jgi:hypothetical protein